MTNSTKTAIVTGASRGIGAGLVEAFLKRGYNVVANSRNIKRENPFAAAANVALVDGDIGDPGTASRIVDTAISRFGRIDVLINNAGVFIPKSFTEYTTEDFNTLAVATCLNWDNCIGGCRQSRGRSLRTRQVGLRIPSSHRAFREGKSPELLCRARCRSAQF